MPFGDYPKRPTLKMSSVNGVLYVEEYINDDASQERKSSWFSTHKNVEFHQEWDGGNNPYISGHKAHYTGRRKATAAEIERHGKELKEIENDWKEKDEKEKQKRIKDLEKQASSLGYKLIKNKK